MYYDRRTRETLAPFSIPKFSIYVEERISRDWEIQRTKKSIEGFMDLRLSFIPIVTVVAVDPGVVVAVVVAER